MHIFWQRRIVEGDATTPWWYPFQTSSGAIREDRIVFPIPPGVNWRDVKAVEIPRAKELPVASGPLPVKRERRKGPAFSRLATGNSQLATAGKVGILVGGRIKYIDRPGAPAAGATAQTNPAKTREKKEVVKPPKPKYDPKYLAAARELRDRYLERVNDQLALPACAKYEVSRTLPAMSSVESSAAEGSRSRNATGRASLALPDAA